MKQLKSGFRNIIQKNKFKIIAALFSGVAIILFGCDAEVEKIEAFSSPETLPVIYAENFETTFIDSFKIQSYMNAPIMQKFESKEQSFIEFPQGITLLRYGSNEKIISRITADYARNYEKEKKWEAKNNVVAVNAQGDTLKTEYLIWEENTGRIHSDKFVKIIQSEQIITGIGFEADQNLQNWEIKDPKGTIYITVNQDEQNSEGNVLNEEENNSLKPVQINN